MKSKPFQSILTVLLSAGALGGIPCTAPLTYADGGQEPASSMTVIEDKGTTWWSVQELLKFYPEVEAEKDAECGDNQDCRMEFGWSMIERGPKYSALNNLLEGQFWVTSVNPSAETVKVLFFDNDMMLRHMGIEEKLEIEHLYLGWFDEWKGQIYNYDHDGFTNGSISGSHPLYDSTVEDIDAIVPWEEVELSVAGGNLIENTTGKLDYALYAKYNMFNAQGHFDYSSCLRAPDYQDGMECQMMVSGDQWVSYFPPRESIIEQTTTINEPDNGETGDNEQETPSSESETQPFNPEIPPAETETPSTGSTTLPSESETSSTGSETNIAESENPALEPNEPPAEQDETIAELGNITTNSENPSLDVTTTPISISISAVMSEVESSAPKAPETGNGQVENSDSELSSQSHIIWLIVGVLGGIFVLSVWFLLKVFRFQSKNEQNL